MKDSGPFKLEFPADTAFVGAARAFCTAIADEAGVDAEAREDVKLAVSEASTNAIWSREVSPASGPIRVTIKREADELLVEVEDAGLSVTPEEPDPSSPPAGQHDSVGTARVDLIGALFPGVDVGVTQTGRLRVAFVIKVSERAVR
ncbi:MAG: ATP-binding protein [Actinomycetota bacterium]